MRDQTVYQERINQMASVNLSYSDQVDRDNVQHLRELLTELPPYCRTYFRGIEPRTQSRTRIAYAYDLRVFFQYLMSENPEVRKKYLGQNFELRKAVLHERVED